MREAQAQADRPPCPAPAQLRAEAAAFDEEAEVGRWDGPHYRTTYRVLGQGPPLVLLPGVVSSSRLNALVLNRLAGRFRTVTLSYPGDEPDGGATLAKVGHAALAETLFGLFEHLRIGRAFLLGLGFGATVALGLLHVEPRRFPRAVLQGGSARRRIAPLERLLLGLAHHWPGTVGQLPGWETVLAHNVRAEFPRLLEERWEAYREEFSRVPVRVLAHRLGLIAGLDLRPALSQIPTEIGLLHGNEDRLVPRRYLDELSGGLPNARVAILPTVGHLPALTHAEAFAAAVSEFLLPCTPGGCPNEGTSPEDGAGTGAG